MITPAVARKTRWERRFGSRFITVAIDDRRGKKFSGNRLYFREGYAVLDGSDVLEGAGIEVVQAAA